jgi:hypothetical protein
VNYWWVNQTDNWQDEFNRGYLYAGESSHAYRKSILDVRKDDLVICTHGTGEKRRIYATGIIAADPSGKIVPRRQPRAVRRAKKPALPDGWEVPIDYDELEHPVPWAPIRSGLQGKFVAKHFTKKSAGVQEYLFLFHPRQPARFCGWLIGSNHPVPGYDLGRPLFVADCSQTNSAPNQPVRSALIQPRKSRDCCLATSNTWSGIAPFSVRNAQDRSPGAACEMVRRHFLRLGFRARNSATFG